ncbi:ATP-binding protein [Marivita sp.]|uniref:ATP-binding protein n=1 Tax=Marivita sp. TaxID=2003365 RepID=UPI003B523D3E
MLTHPTSERLEAMGFMGMAKALDEQRRASDMFDSLSFEERLGLLVDREAAERDAKKLATRLRFASLRQAACVEDLDMRSPRGIDKSVMAHLIDGGWIDRHENLLITGPTDPAL